MDGHRREKHSGPINKLLTVFTKPSVLYKSNSRLSNHMLLYIILNLFFMESIFLPQLSAQTIRQPGRWQVDTLVVVDSSRYSFKIPDTHRLRESTLRIYRNRIMLRAATDFRLIENDSVDFFSSLTKGDSLQIKYERLPFNFKRRYELFRRELLTRDPLLDSLIQAKKAFALRENRIENPFVNLGGGIQTNGSIMRGFQIGTNRDLTLNSGLNVELSGKLTENVDIIAALTDEATPIQPEGNTQTLQEVDKVFVQFKTPYVDGTVGDFNLTSEQTQFGKFSRKLQGITAEGRYKDSGLSATIASTRGFFHRVSFIGREGNQGPYQLTGRNGESDIIVLAGTERVWLNGEKLTRGESNDYVIEYGNGQVRFTTKRLISSESRIEIDFEYFPSVQKYNRNVYSAAAASSFASNRIRFGLRIYRESDDPSQVLESEGLSAEEKSIIRASGDSALSAITSGAVYRGALAGDYVKIDTLVNSTSDSIYVYAGKNLGDYYVSFSFIGENQGDYVRDRLGVYRWVGYKNGNYLPVRLLPLPSTHDLADIDLAWHPAENLNITAEYAGTRFDANSLSSQDDEDNQGSAIQVAANLTETALRIGSATLGKTRMAFQSRYVQNTFRSIDRVNPADFRRYWNVLNNDSQNSNEEKSLQFDGTYIPIEPVAFSVNFGQLNRADFRSNRILGKIDIQSNSILSGSAKYEYVGSSSSQTATKNDWQRYAGNAGRSLWKFRPEFFYEGELRKNKIADQLTGFKFDDLGLRMNFINWRYFEGFVQYGQRYDRVYDYENYAALLPQAFTETKRLQFSLLNISETNATLQIVQRRKDYADRFENIKIEDDKLRYVDVTYQDTVWQDRTTNLAELVLNHARGNRAVQLSWQYRISTEQTALREKVYLDVGEGRGTWRYDEYLKEYVPDADGNFLLFILPSGQFQPVTNLQTALRLQLDPANYWRDTNSFLSRWLTNISGESYIRIDEETRESEIQSIYLLNLSRFQGDQTIRGTIQFNQDIFLLRRNRDLSFRLRYRYLDGLTNQYLDANENENRLTEETSVRADWRMSAALRSQTEIRTKQNSRESKANLLRNRNIRGYFANQYLSWRPKNRWEFGLECEYGNEDNRTIQYPIRLWYGVLKGRTDYSLIGKGRASAEYRYQSVNIISNPFGFTVPFEMAGGKRKGVSQTWQLRLEYTVAQNVLVTAFYNGRRDAGFDKTVHTGQAEVRAYF